MYHAMTILVLSPFIFSGNDPVEEDVDIVGGNDPPVSSYPPVEIEKDAANRNSKCSSSSSSSSESGSSSSGSCFCVHFICFFGFTICFQFTEIWRVECRISLFMLNCILYSFIIHTVKHIFLLPNFANLSLSLSPPPTPKKKKKRLETIHFLKKIVETVIYLHAVVFELVCGFVKSSLFFTLTNIFSYC